MIELILTLTGIISSNGSLHQSLHPLTNNHLLVRAKIMCLFCVVDQTETIATRIYILIDDDLVASNVDIALDLRQLQGAIRLNAALRA